MYQLWDFVIDIYGSKITCFPNASHKLKPYHLVLLFKKDGEIPYTLEFCGVFRSKQIKDNKNENKNMCKHQVI